MYLEKNQVTPSTFKFNKSTTQFTLRSQSWCFYSAKSHYSLSENHFEIIYNSIAEQSYYFLRHFHKFPKRLTSTKFYLLSHTHTEWFSYPWQPTGNKVLTADGLAIPLLLLFPNNYGDHLFIFRLVELICWQILILKRLKSIQFYTTFFVHFIK